MRRWRKRLEEQGPKGLLDRRRGTPSPHRIPKEQAEEVLSLYRDKYFDLNVRHFHEKLREDHQIGLSYTWVKQALQGTGLVKLTGGSAELPSFMTTRFLQRASCPLFGSSQGITPSSTTPLTC
jgi:hypothetical protein